MSRVIKEVPTIEEARKLIGARVRSHKGHSTVSYEGVVRRVSIDADCDLSIDLLGNVNIFVSPDWNGRTYWIEVLEEGPDYCSPETIQEKEARLAQELADVREEIARDGAPEGCKWSTHRDKPCLDGKGFHVSFNDEEHTQMFIRDDRRNYAAAPLDMIFAWVDKVREDSQT